MTEWGLSMAGCEDTILDAVDRVLVDVTRRPLIYVEIGVAGGLTFAQVCKHLDANLKDWHAIGVDLPDDAEGLVKGVWCLDTESFDRVTRPYIVRARLVRQASQDFFRTWVHVPISLLLIDGCHEKDCVKADFEKAEPQIVPGGCVIFHDTAQWSQGDSPQPHKGFPIETRQAILELGLLPVTRPGWAFVAEADGRQDQGGRGCMVFQRKG